MTRPKRDEKKDADKMSAEKQEHVPSAAEQAVLDARPGKWADLSLRLGEAQGLLTELDAGPGPFRVIAQLAKIRGRLDKMAKRDAERVTGRDKRVANLRRKFAALQRQAIGLKIDLTLEGLSK